MERGQRLGQPGRLGLETAGLAAMGVPAAEIGGRDREADLGLGEVGDSLERRRVTTVTSSPGCDSLSALRGKYRTPRRVER